MFENEKQDYYYTDECKELIEKFLTICLPVTITPCVDVKRIKSECCGNPIITPNHHKNCCKGKDDDGSCEFTIVQKMKVEIPLEFKAETKIDDPFVDCEFKKDCEECKDKEHKDDCKIHDYKEYEDKK